MANEEIDLDSIREFVFLANYDEHKTKWGEEFSNLLKSLKYLDIWRTSWPHHDDDLDALFTGIITDAHLSIAFSSCGLYRYGFVVLRSQIEGIAHLLFFTDHPRERYWWSKGKNPWGKAEFPWGRWNYFEDNIEQILTFRKKVANKGEEEDGKQIQTIMQPVYSLLSKYVHTSAKSKGTGVIPLSTAYDEGKLNSFKSLFTQTQDICCIYIILYIPDIFNDLSGAKQKDVLTCISNDDWRSALEAIIENGD